MPGERVKADTTAVPNRRLGETAPAITSGVNASRPFDSADQTSV
jgi:hypothetical protein